MKKFLKLFKKKKINKIINNNSNYTIIILRYDNFSKFNNFFLKKLSLKYNFFFYKPKNSFLKSYFNQNGGLIFIYFNIFNLELIKKLNNISSVNLILIKLNTVFSKIKLNKYFNNNNFGNSGLTVFLKNNFSFISSYSNLYKFYLIKFIFIIKFNF